MEILAFNPNTGGQYVECQNLLEDREHSCTDFDKKRQRIVYDFHFELIKDSDSAGVWIFCQMTIFMTGSFYDQNLGLNDHKKSCMSIA